MKARSWSVMFLGAALLVAMSSESNAQFGRRGGGRGFSSPLSLVSNETVQKELGLSEDQIKKVGALGEEVRAERERLFAEWQSGAGDLQSLSNEERRAKLGEAMSEVGKKINEKFSPKLKEILEEKQNERLKQISWQMAGARAYSDPEVVKALGLSKEQQEKLTALGKDSDKKLREAFTGGDSGPEKFIQLNEELAAKSKDVLSKEQQDKFDELKGKPFDVASIRGGGRGPRGEGGRSGAGRRQGRPAAEGSGEKKEEKKAE